MKKVIIGLIASLGLLQLVLANNITQKITIQSHTPQDYSDNLSGKYLQSPVNIHGFLTLPGSTTKSPLVVIVPGSGGYKSWMQDMVAKRLNDIGIATLVIDSFTGRGITEVATDQSKVSTAATVIDGFAALKALEGRTEIDTSRLGITGFSRGGTVAMFTQEKKLLEAMKLGGIQYASHLPMYPACSTTFEKPSPTAAPIWFLMGDKDDYTPISQCAPYIERLSSAGGLVRSKIYPNSHHGFVSETQGVAYVGRLQVFAKCDARIDADGIIKELTSGATSSEGWSAFVAKVWKSCGKYGAHYGANQTTRDEALSDMVQFFKETLRP